LHQVGDLFELNVTLQCQKVKLQGEIFKIELHQNA